MLDIEISVDGGPWADFPVDVNVSDATFGTYVNSFGVPTAEWDEKVSRTHSTRSPTIPLRAWVPGRFMSILFLCEPMCPGARSGHLSGTEVVGPAGQGVEVQNPGHEPRHKVVAACFRAEPSTT